MGLKKICSAKCHALSHKAVIKHLTAAERGLQKKEEVVYREFSCSIMHNDSGDNLDWRHFVKAACLCSLHSASQGSILELIRTIEECVQGRRPTIFLCVS